MRHTPRHVNCPACDSRWQGLLKSKDYADLKFEDAAKQWLANTRRNFAPRTQKDHEDFVRRLNRFFGELVVRNIHPGNIKEYQDSRQGLCADPDDNLGKSGPEVVNHEISAVLSKILDEAGTWKAMKPFYERLPVPESTAGRSMSAEEEERLIVCAASNPRWKVAYWCSLLSVNTTAGPGEITHIRVKSIDLRRRVLSIQDGLKNAKRLRHLPMTETIQWVCEKLLKRYYRICEEYGIVPDPEHYVLPGRKRDGPYDPTKPMGSWKKAWKGLVEKADLKGLRMYDLRHQSETKLMEAWGVTEHTIVDITGSELRKPYRHIRNDPKLEALQQIEVKPAPQLVAAGEILGPNDGRHVSSFGTLGGRPPRAQRERVECPVPAKVTGTT